MRRDLAGHDRHAGGQQCLDRHAAAGFLAQELVEDAVRDVVGQLVRVAFGNRFRRIELPHDLRSLHMPGGVSQNRLERDVAAVPGMTGGARAPWLPQPTPPGAGHGTRPAALDISQMTSGSSAP
ncbi:hypothetical protein DGo_CA0952 [Deinococcus gobiensis I-0]|uniref:Uncharacterized protein n=1 Tax=Deinococcus gobiensis (strain DSM 21396 / JCM 16679 / CGMCC 1.7299 / I-0) TaxID=745776 RepID=H8GYV2_DEIGI|nr:hypothetical protein DGo_CA0952 [Deinococcus gobiensis I-0]